MVSSSENFGPREKVQFFCFLMCLNVFFFSKWGLHVFPFLFSLLCIIYLSLSCQCVHMLSVWPLLPQSLSECEDSNYTESDDYTSELFLGTVHFVYQKNVHINFTRLLWERLTLAVWDIFSEAFLGKFSFFCICSLFFFVHSSEHYNEL